jgi:hypothetical protein
MSSLSTSLKRPTLRRAAPFAAGAALIGIVVVAISSAAGPLAAFEAESGTRSGNVSAIADTTASGGSLVKFGPSQKPDASNTGYPAAQAFTSYTGSNNSSVANTTFDGVNFGNPGSPGWYVFTGDNLTFKNCKIASDIWIEGNNVTIDHCDITGGISINNSNTVTIRYNNIHAWEDGLHITADKATVKNITVSQNYFHAPNPSCGAHSDGVQLLGVNGFIATQNTIDMGRQFILCGDPNPLNGTFQIATDFTGVQNTNLAITGNWLNGGGYTLRLYDCGGMSSITGNRLGRDYSYGPVDTPGSTCLQDKSGNVFDDNGSPISL